MVYTHFILHCRESKRKTAAVVALRNDERLFGDAALNTVGCVCVCVCTHMYSNAEHLALSVFFLCVFICGEEGEL